MAKYVLAFFCLFLLGACDNGDGAKTAAPGPAQPLSIIRADGVPQDFNVELALTPAAQQQGLMFRKQMDENHGMLFVFPGDETERAFWMKNTLIPLDMIFIRKDGTIHHIHENAVPEDLTSVPSNGPVMAVLELNGGVSAKRGLKPGDVVHHTVFGNGK